MPPPPDTLLVITGPGIADYSCRGATQTLDPVDESSKLERTINGALINLSPAQMQKFKSTISCTDVEAPAFDGLWPGMQLGVDCVAELGYHTATGAPTRTVVPGSERTSGAWTYYRPHLEMLVVQYTVSRDEYGHLTQWQLELAEI
jgi:hypothetical protein